MLNTNIKMLICHADWLFFFHSFITMNFLILLLCVLTITIPYPCNHVLMLEVVRLYDLTLQVSISFSSPIASKHLEPQESKKIKINS